MTTRRERIEARLERRRQWAETRKAKSDASFDAAHKMAEAIPLGQPILVGHHSERWARRYQERMHSKMAKAVEHHDMAATHASKANNIEAALDRSIFSDDADAKEQLAKRAGGRDAAADRMVALNALWRKMGKPTVQDWLGQPWEPFYQAAQLTDAEKDAIGTNYRYGSNGLGAAPPFPAYAISNRRANARRDKQRQKIIDARAANQELAAAAPNGVVIVGDDYCNVTFAEKPAREIINALKAASFYWTGGRWGGYRKNLPPCVLALLEVQP